MALARHTATDALLTELQRGAQDAPALCRLLGISQPTLSRLITRAGDAVLRVGKARASRYLASRSINGQIALPLFRVTRQGQLEQWGTLRPVYPDSHLVVQFNDGRPDECFEGLPWWLQDMRPQGFLGRTWAYRRAAALGLPADLQTWNDNHVLTALAAGEQDSIGNLLVGEATRAAWLARPDPVLVNHAQRPARYTEMAAAVMAGEPVGSSAAGEQPKFACAVANGPAEQAQQAVLVKFSVSADTPSTQRWRDLLLAEHLALLTLRRHGLPAAESIVLDVSSAGGPPQRFLELARFDRLGAHGRCGLVSLAALEAGLLGRAQWAWPELTQQLAEQKHITVASAELAARFYVFGRLIGNTDMHHGNIAFLHQGRRPLELAPCYDMLPMSLAPDRNGVMRDDLLPFIIPSQPDVALWQDTLPMAREYWAQLAVEPRVSADFRQLAARQAGWLDSFEQQLDRLLPG